MVNMSCDWSEVHVELMTKSKLFCACPNRFTTEPTAACEVCPFQGRSPAEPKRCKGADRFPCVKL